MSLAAEFVESVEHHEDGYYVHTPGGRVLGPFDSRASAGMEDMFWVNGADAGDEDELFGEAEEKLGKAGIYVRLTFLPAGVKKKRTVWAKILKRGKLNTYLVVDKEGSAVEKRTAKGFAREVVAALPRSKTTKERPARMNLHYGELQITEADEPGDGEEPADSSLARKLAKQTLGNKASIALPFRQLWRHKYIEKNYDASQAWKLFYWATTHGGAGGKGFNPATRKAASKLMVSAFSRWAKADMKAKVKRADGMTEKPVGEISRAEFVKWFMSSAPGTSESGLHEQFVEQEYGRKPQMVRPKKPQDDPEFDLGVRIAREGTKLFRTGLLVKFRFMHNDERAPNVGGRFQQDIEPSGYYMTTAPDDRTVERLRKAGQKFTIGTADFRSPLVLDWGAAYDQSSWKYRLSQHYDAKKRGLTKALLRDGYDGIVTVRRGVTSEIVALKGKPKMVESLRGLFVEQAGEPKPPKKEPPEDEPEDEPEDAPEDAPEMSDLEKEEEKAEKLGYELKDVQAYYDMQIATGLDQGAALVKTKKKFKLRRLRISPIGKIMAPDLPNPEKERKKQDAQAPPPLPPEEPAGGGEGPATGGTFPEGPKGPSGPQGPPTPGEEE